MNDSMGQFLTQSHHRRLKDGRVEHLPDVLWEWIPNIGSKESESAKAMNLVFVLWDFEHTGIWRIVKRVRQSVDMYEFREVS